jgi:segregation and condensation protein A
MNDDSSTLASSSQLAVVAGKPLTEMPADLFIPPDALLVLLDSFSGPLDLLLYLIRHQNIDILDIPIARISQQYMQYIQLMEAHRLELAADYLVMAAMLAEIKSRLLLPVHPCQQEDLEADPRAELVRKLQAYEQIKHAALEIDKLPRCDRDLFRFAISAESLVQRISYPKVDLSSITGAMAELLRHQSHLLHHRILGESLSVRERMTEVLARLQYKETLSFTQLILRAEGRMGLIVTFLAILQLARQSLLFITQMTAYAAVYIQAVDHE